MEISGVLVPIFSYLLLLPASNIVDLETSKLKPNRIIIQELELLAGYLQKYVRNIENPSIKVRRISSLTTSSFQCKKFICVTVIKAKGICSPNIHLMIIDEFQGTDVTTASIASNSVSRTANFASWLRLFIRLPKYYPWRSTWYIDRY